MLDTLTGICVDGICVSTAMAILKQSTSASLPVSLYSKMRRDVIALQFTAIMDHTVSAR